MTKKIVTLATVAMLGLSTQAQKVDGYTGATQHVAGEKVDTSTLQKPQMPKKVSPADYDHFRIGGYGEILANFMQYSPWRNPSTGGSPQVGRNTISIPRFVLAADYRFGKSRKWSIGLEVEFEAGGVGTEREIEWDDENGEYETEMEKGGEVALEQFHITREIFPELNVRVGHMILPVGLTNSQHEPLNFFGTSRPEAETAFIPSTWHENGMELFGSLFKGIASYQFLVTAGLNCDGFRRSDWIIPGKQGLFEVDNFTSPAYTVRLDFHPFKTLKGWGDLKIGGSFYRCNNTAANADKTSKYDFDVPVTLGSADVGYKGYGLVTRANFLCGVIGNTDLLSTARRTLPSASGYTARYTAAEKALSAGVEAGYDLSYPIHALRGKFCSGLYPFFRYEYYNPCESVAEGMTKYDQFQVSKWTVGMNYYPFSDLVIKADYTWRSIASGKYNNENEFSLAIAYSGWFFSDKSFKAYLDRRDARREMRQKQVIAEMNKRLDVMQRQIEEMKNK